MNRVDKFLARLDRKRRLKIEEILSRLAQNDFTGLDIRKIKGSEELFRLRVGDIRIIYGVDCGQITLKFINFKNDNTYNI